MARTAVRSRNGKTLLGAPFWRPRQGNTVVLNREVPIAPAVFPDGVEMKLNDVRWRWTHRQRYVLDGDAFKVGTASEDGQGYLLYTTVDDVRSMIYCRSTRDVETVRAGEMEDMRARAEHRNIVAALAWALLYECWQDVQIKDESPLFLKPGEALREAALESAQVFCDDLLENEKAHESLVMRTRDAFSVLHSWIVPFGIHEMVRKRLDPVRWFLRCALYGGKAFGRQHGRLKKYMAVPDWRSFDSNHQFRDMVERYWLEQVGGVGIGEELSRSGWGA